MSFLDVITTSGKTKRPKCINCKRGGRGRPVLIIQALVPDPTGGYEVGSSVPICRPCLRDPICPLASYFADEAR